jgi:predicted transcriptional regulator
VLAFLDALRLSNNKGADWWKDLSDAQKKQIQLGIKDADEGNLLTSEEFWKRIKKA